MIVITFIKIVEALTAAISSRFPDCEVYVESQPQNFKRPSFLVTLGAVTEVPAAKRLVEVNAQFIVRCYPSTSTGHNLPDNTFAFAMRTGIIELFTGESLQVGDRWLTFTLAASGYDQDNEAYVELRTVYMQMSALPIPGGGSAASSDLMNNIDINYQDRSD